MSAVVEPTSADGKSLRAQALRWWVARTPRERAAVMAVGWIVAAFVVFAVFIQPAWRTVRDAPVELDALDLRLQQMQRIAGESRALRGATTVSAQQAATALRAATDRLGDKGRLVLQGDRAVLTLNGVSSEALRAWLGEARNGARARPLEAQLQRGAQGYSGTLTVSLGGTP